MQGTSCLALPIPDHAFFEQTVFQGQVGDDLLERRRFRAELLDLWRGRLAGSIPGQPLFACFEEFLRPRVIQALADALTAAERGNALFAAQALLACLRGCEQAQLELAVAPDAAVFESIPGARDVTVENHRVLLSYEGKMAELLRTVAEAAVAGVALGAIVVIVSGS